MKPFGRVSSDRSAIRLKSISELRSENKFERNDCAVRMQSMKFTDNVLNIERRLDNTCDAQRGRREKKRKLAKC